MEQTVAIVALVIMAVGLIALIIGVNEFVKMLAPPETLKRADSPASPNASELPLAGGN
jgi:hypothetical protein